MAAAERTLAGVVNDARPVDLERRAVGVQAEEVLAVARHLDRARPLAETEPPERRRIEGIGAERKRHRRRDRRAGAAGRPEYLEFSTACPPTILR